MKAGFIALAVACSVLPPALASAQGVSREDCFPIERLSSRLRQRSEELLLTALDNEALYTFVGDLKPMSSFVEFRLPLGELDLTPLETTRQALTAWRCGDEIYADVRHFAQPHEDRLYAEGAVWNRRLLAELIGRYTPFFARFGLTPSAHPMEATLAVEYASGLDRFRGYGYLYGYPDYAVSFFTEAQSEQIRGGRRVERDVVSVPTYARPAGAYAWAVARGHQENDADRNLKRRAAAVLADYRARRERYIGERKPGVVALLRDWFDDGQGRCAPRNASLVALRDAK